MERHDEGLGGARAVWLGWIVLALAACSADRRDNPFEGQGPSTETLGSDADGGETGQSGDAEGDTTSGQIFDVGTDPGPGPGSGPGGDPTTCEEAAEHATYVGCDFWPTVTSNAAWTIWDFAVVVANAGDEDAEVTVERGGAPIGETTVIPPNELRTIFLPWVDELKGTPADACGTPAPSLGATVRVVDGAYHLVSSRPVTAYQFNPLEYAPEGGPPGKDWSSCPAPQCTMAQVGCFSYSNDASLLLPSTALTANYRVTGYAGSEIADLNSLLAVTGIEDDTNVMVELSSRAQLFEGPGVPPAGAGGQTSFTIDQGEVVLLASPTSADLSGSLVHADKPVQLISAMACAQVPYGTSACDHVEESVFPAETLGSHYFVTVPTSPDGLPVAHLVRLYGNVDGTQLSYPSGRPPGFPDTLDAGEVVEVGHSELVIEPFENPPFYWDNSVNVDFEIVGDHEFAVASFQFGAQALGSDTTPSELGDPSQSLVTTVEQYRTKYVFLAPTDYPVSFVDVVQPMGATVELDGEVLDVTVTEIGESGYGIRRVPLPQANGGAHVLQSDEPVGLQVMGYGDYTSYQYPGGLNLEVIAPPPTPAG